MGSDEITSSPCKCFSLLGLTFVEIKKSFTKPLLTLIVSLLEYFFIERKQMKVGLSNVLMIYYYSFYGIL